MSDSASGKAFWSQAQNLTVQLQPELIGGIRVVVGDDWCFGHFGQSPFGDIAQMKVTLTALPPSRHNQKEGKSHATQSAEIRELIKSRIEGLANDSQAFAIKEQ